MIIYFIQLLCISSFFIDKKGETIIQIFDYYKNIFVVSNLISSNQKYYLQLFIINNVIIYLDIILMVIILFTYRIKKINILSSLVNLINIIIFYYYIGPAIEISIMSFWCENGKQKLLDVKCFSSAIHRLYISFSLMNFLFYIFVSIIFSIFHNEIGYISINSNKKVTRIHSNYEVYSLLIKIIIFVFHSIIKIKENYILKLLYIILIFMLSISIFIYIYRNVYYYNNIINYIISIGWLLNSWYCICIFVKFQFKINSISVFILMGWIIILLLVYKRIKIIDYLLITKSNILDFNSIKSIEKYNNLLLDGLMNKTNNTSKIILFGIIKNYEEYLKENPEINYCYQKILLDKFLKYNYNTELDFRTLAIIYIIYTIQIEKSLYKDEIALYMAYFLINKLDNPIYAIFLFSKLNANGMRLYYKYLLLEDLREYLTYKLKIPNKETINHVQIGCVILYYLYIDLLKLKIYDGITNQIDYFEILKSNITNNKSTSNFLKNANKIWETRKEILKIWENIVKLNPFSDEIFKDYIQYLDTILQDQIIVREEYKKYKKIKVDNNEKRFNTYHNMFLIDKSSISLVDGYSLIGKILYSSPNFSFLFSYNSKDILNFNIDDLLPNVIQSFHKELINDAIKHSNITYKFKKPINSLLKNKNGGLCNIKLYIKPVPNFNYGLIYFIFLEKIQKSDFIILLDKDLKINGFSEMGGTGSSFTMGAGYNLSHSLYGYHIG